MFSLYRQSYTMTEILTRKSFDVYEISKRKFRRNDVSKMVLYEVPAFITQQKHQF